jgi:hypothetical protein
MSYEHCHKHDCEATNGCAECAKEATPPGPDQNQNKKRRVRRDERVPCHNCDGLKERRAKQCIACTAKSCAGTLRGEIKPPPSDAELASELWRKIPGFEQYEVSGLGRVRRDGRIRKFVLQRNYPYLTITLWRDGKEHRKSAHRLVLEAFVGPCPPGHECAHGDGNPGNPRLTNLRWATPTENHADKKLHGTDNGGARNPMSRQRLDMRSGKASQ